MDERSPTNAATKGIGMKKLASVLLLIADVSSGCSWRGGGSTPTPQPTVTNAPPPATASPPGADVAFTIWSPDSAQSSVSVDADGFQVDAGRVRVSAPAGVAAPETAVTVATPAEPRLPDAATFSSVAGNPVRVTLGDGEQPRQPVTIVLDLAGTELATRAANGATLGVIAQSEGSSGIELLPATWDNEAQTLTVVTPHLSWFWPFEFDAAKLIKAMVAAISEGLGFGADPPDCYGKPLTVGRTTYRIDPVPYQIVWPCLTASSTPGERPYTLELHSNIGQPWRARTDPSAPGSVSDLSNLAGFAMLEFYNALFSSYANRESIVIPGAMTLFQFNEANLPRRVSLEIEAGIHLAASLVFGVEMMVEVFNLDSGLLSLPDIRDCLTGFIDAYTNAEVARDARRFVSTVMGCVQAAAGGALAVVVSILATGIPLLVSQLQGLILTWTGASNVTFAIAREGPVAGSVVGEWGAQHVLLTVNGDGTGSLNINSGCCVGVIFALDVDLQGKPVTATIVSREFFARDGFAPFDPERFPEPGDVITLRTEPAEDRELLYITMPGRDEDIVVCNPGASDCLTGV